MHDITSNKLEEIRLKLLQSVITNTTDAVVITEAEPFDINIHKIIYVNDAFTKITGYSAEEVIGKRPGFLQGPNTNTDELNKFRTALQRWEHCEVTLLKYKKAEKNFGSTFLLAQ